MLRLNEFLYLSRVRMTGNNNRLFARPIFAALSFGLAASLAACSSSDTETAGGGPSGTEAGNAITAQILVAGAPAALAKVKLVESESLDGTDVKSVETDSNGMVSFNDVDEGFYTLEAKLNDLALQKEVFVTGDAQDLGKGELEKIVSVTGSVGDKENGTVKVRGMDHSARVIDGEFTLDSLPAGPLSLVFIPNSEKADTRSTYMKVVAGENTTASTFADESRALLLDDFQDSNYQNRFMPAHTYDGGWWYFNYSEKNVTPSFVTDDGQHTFELANEGDGNIVAHVAAEFGESYEDPSGQNHWPWATIGVELGKSDKALCNDISSVDSVGFRIKGKGAMVFIVVDETQKIEDQIIAQYEFNLHEDWEQIVVPLKEILDDRFSYNCVNQLGWNFKNTSEDNIVEVWLDDVELIGGKRLSIWKK